MEQEKTLHWGLEVHRVSSQVCFFPFFCLFLNITNNIYLQTATTVIRRVWCGFYFNFNYFTKFLVFHVRPPLRTTTKTIKTGLKHDHQCSCVLIVDIAWTVQVVTVLPKQQIHHDSITIKNTQDKKIFFTVHPWNFCPVQSCLQ